MLNAFCEQVVSVNTSKRLKELCALVFDSVVPYSDLSELGALLPRRFLQHRDSEAGIEIPGSDQEKLDQALAWLFSGCA
jgi:hypothetical protein